MKKLKILWLSPNPGLFNNNSHRNRYNGEGWISSLQELLIHNENIQLALAFICNYKINKESQNNTIYYPIFQKKPNPFKKILSYYGLNSESSFLLDSVLSIIADYKPDIIHLFGFENRLACVLGNTSVPIIVHLQGILPPIDNAFWPIGFNKHTVLWPPTIREWFLRNGYIHKKNEIKKKGRNLQKLFHTTRFFMGRTEWDRQMTTIFSPDCIYNHVDEVLRPPFYKNINKWHSRDDRLIIVSTISETIYKGLDLVLKTAELLTQFTNINYEWRVIGINPASDFVRLFERSLNIDSSKVSIIYSGVKNADQIVETLLESTIYVHPSYIDNSPNSICEAQLVGVPVIACNVGGVSTLLENGKAGTLIPANAPYELAFHLINYMNNPEVYQTKRLYALTLSQNRHNKEKIMQSLIEAYNDTIRLCNK